MKKKVRGHYGRTRVPYLFIEEFSIFRVLTHLELTNSPVWHQKLIPHAESWESQLSNGIRVGGSWTESYERNIHWHAVVEIVISTEFWCDLQTWHLFRSNEPQSNSYVIFYRKENYISTWRAVICWSFYRDVMWFVGPLAKIFMLSQKVAYIDAYTTGELFDKFRSKRRFRRHEYLEYRNLISPPNKEVSLHHLNHCSNVFTKSLAVWEDGCLIFTKLKPRKEATKNNSPFMNNTPLPLMLYIYLFVWNPPGSSHIQLPWFHPVWDTKYHKKSHLVQNLRYHRFCIYSYIQKVLCRHDFWIFREQWRITKKVLYHV